MADVVKAGFWYCKESQQGVSASNAPIHFTHLYCAFANISRTYDVIIPAQDQHTFTNFTKEATEKNSHIKTLMSIGGEDSDPSTFASMFSNQEGRARFIRSSIRQARAYKFHGLDLFWPCWGEYNPTAVHMTNLGLLLNEWSKAIVDEAIKETKEQLLLSATVFYKPIIVGNMTRYPLEAFQRLDWINVRAYDFYDPRSSPSKTGPPATFNNTNLEEQAKCVVSGINDWIATELDPNKLVIGLPFVGFEWALVDPNHHGFFAPANGAGSTGNRVDGHIFYRDIITNATFMHNHKFDEDFGTDYCYAGSNWIGYDDTRSIIAKIAYARTNGLLGYFGWHVCADDHNWTLSRTASDEWDTPVQSGG